MHLRTDPRVYGPEEDTYLLLDALVNESLSGDGLELGTGTGIIAITLCDRFTTFTAVDISPYAVALAQENARAHKKNIRVFQSDLFSNVTRTYDVIIFNPPYVPADEKITSVEDAAYHGGEDGRRVIDQFLFQFQPYLTPHGKVYFLQSSLSNISKTFHTLTSLRFSPTVIARKHLFFEELVVLKIERQVIS